MARSSGGIREILENGVIKENPTLVQVLGTCPTLAVTTSVENGIGMGIAASAVLIGSNIAISLIRKLVPEKIRIAVYVVVIATFVTAIEMLMKAFAPDLSQRLGIFIPLIVVNCIILARAEAFASKNSVPRSAADGLAMGIGFTMALLIISSIREVLGSGKFFGLPLFGDGFLPATMFIMPAGAFLVFGCVIAAMQYIRSRGKERS